jgi:uncharacterized protein involved in outer membrane biogenesis
MAPARESSPRRSVWRWLGGSALVLCIAAGVLWAFWDWNWFRPLVEARLSAALGPPVTLDRLHVQPGRIVDLAADNVRIANPEGFQGSDFATIGRVHLTFDFVTWWHTNRIVLPQVSVDTPKFDIVEDNNGHGNWITVPAPTGKDTIQIDNLEVRDGGAHVVIAKDNSDVTLTLATRPSPDGGALIVDGKGTYSRQPIAFHGLGGGVLRLSDTTKPYPIDFTLANGETRITVKGQVQNPLAMTGANLRLALSGPDMALLFPLTGIATPKTPPYQVSGRLDFTQGLVKFTEIAGRVGSSDLSGDLAVDTRGPRRVLTGAIISHQVDMADLGGFVGSTPGRTTTPGQTPRQVEEVKRAESSPKLLPTTPISVPKVRAADVHITYKGDKIIGKDIPFDSIAVKLDIEDGHIHLEPFRVGIGSGGLNGSIDLNPVGNEVDADADITVERVDISRVLASTGLGKGEGAIDGAAKVKGRGASLSAILAHGDGMLRVTMPGGGNINSLLVDLLGIELGRAFFAAIGIPDTETIQCAVVDFVLQKGILASRMMEVNTTQHVVTGGGRIDLSREVMEMYLRTDPKHFTVGTLATPIRIAGPFKNLSFAPAPELAVRGGAAIGLGLLFPPAAILPTIQFGVGEGSPCIRPGRPQSSR